MTDHVTDALGEVARKQKLLLKAEARSALANSTALDEAGKRDERIKMCEEAVVATNIKVSTA